MLELSHQVSESKIQPQTRSMFLLVHKQTKGAFKLKPASLCAKRYTWLEDGACPISRNTDSDDTIANTPAEA